MKRRVSPFLLIVLLTSTTALAYPEFEAWSEKTSGKFVDCAMCHTHPDGPEGVKPGQIRSLSREELAKLNESRAAFEPGVVIDSPILNAFGDRIIEKLGKKRVIELRSSGPGQLVGLYGMESDLDGDGIPDAREYMQGSSPVDSRSGDPWTLFKGNLRQYWLDILMTIIATIAGLYGLKQILRWFEYHSESPEVIAAKETDSTLGYLARRAAGRRRGR
ncbi:MAG: hypothetical protein WA208_13335 [Thermoanaerobaculia bacterium]